LKQVEKLRIAQEVIGDLIDAEVRRRAGSFKNSEEAKRASEARWNKQKALQAAQ
jgi:hypothetical protein